MAIEKISVLFSGKIFKLKDARKVSDEIFMTESIFELSKGLKNVKTFK